MPRHSGSEDTIADGEPEVDRVRRENKAVVIAGKDKWVIEDARNVLERAGVQVMSARTAAAAVELVRAQPAEIGAVLLDFPTADAEFQIAVSEIRGIDAAIHVILFEEEDGRDNVSAWANAVVRRPLHPLALAQQVRESLAAVRRPELDQ